MNLLSAMKSRRGCAVSETRGYEGGSGNGAALSDPPHCPAASWLSYSEEGRARKAEAIPRVAPVESVYTGVFA